MGRFLAALCLLNSCTNPDYTVYGIKVYLDSGIGPTKEKMIEATDFFIHSVAESFKEEPGQIKEYIKFVDSVVWYKDPINYNDGLYSGLYSGSYIEVMYLGCIYRSAYYHEYTHHMAYVLGIKDTTDVGDLAKLNEAITTSSALIIYGCSEEQNE